MKEQITKQFQEMMSETFALLLWENGAIKVNLDQPFKLASGNYSPLYINCRQVISDPAFMHLFAAVAETVCRRNDLNIEAVAGGETAGIPFGAYVAQGMSLPFMYVRKAKKGYGLANLVEGGEFAGKRVLLVEDLITDGASKVHFINVLRTAHAVVKDILVLFDRDQGGKETLKGEGLILHSITDLPTSLKIAKKLGLISEEQLDSIEMYLKDPSGWHVRHGLDYSF